jgi:aromatic-L-amino-acid decarboxylase
VVMGWLRQLMGLPDGWFGMINDTASISTMLALAAAREARPELQVRELGLAGRADIPVMRVYCSEHAHSSVDKGAMALGIGRANVVKIPVDSGFRMRADALAEAITADREAGMLPVACVATVGSTSTTSVDPVPVIADVCEANDVWLHVDGAYGGVAAIVPELRGILEGVERADSLVVNPHKWLFTPVDCSAFYTRRPDVLRRAFSLVPEYLATPESDAVNFMDYGVQLGRRFRALKLWMVLRSFGAEGLAARLKHHCELAREFARWVEDDPCWELMAPVPLSVVCFRWKGDGTLPDEQLDAINERMLHAVNDTGRAYLSHTKLNGRYVIRLAIGNLRTEREHVREAWELLREEGPGSRN